MELLVINHGDMSTAMQSTLVIYEFRSNIEEYYVVASKSLSDNEIFVVCVLII